MSFLDTFRVLEAHRGRLDRERENSGRLAKSYQSFQVTGWGESVVPGVLDFGVTFIDEPSFTFGYAIEDAGPDLVDGRFPRGLAFVYKWRRGPNASYTGAWCGFVVETVGYEMSGGSFPTTTDPEYVLNFSLQFEGVALKDLPTAVIDQAVRL